MVGLAVAGGVGALAAAAPGREALGAGAGVQDVRASVRAAAVSAGANGSEVGVPLVVVEPAPADLLAVGDGVALLTARSLKSGCGCPDPPRPRAQSCRKSGVTYKRS